ncbi:MAG: preprotein translocase subunit SecG [Muribaculaceae bacterium]|nr:preprotein translocase subunit SecG [Muribaculaceae bacterium]
MYTVLAILISIASILMIGVVLIQKSKGGGLAANVNNYNQFMGVRKTTDFVEKATWGLAIFICVLSIASAFVSAPTMIQGAPQIKKLPTAEAPAAIPTAGQEQAAPAAATEAPAQATEAPATEAAAPAAETPAEAPAEAPAK